MRHPSVPPRLFERLRRHAGLLGCLMALPLLSCGSSRDQTGEFYTDWDRAGGCAAVQLVADERVDGTGRRVDVCDKVEEGWIWVTYAAAWCGASQTQAAAIRELLRSAGPSLQVYTVLTSADEPFQPAGVAEARRWAGRFGLPPERVLAEGHSIRTLPQHLLIGPDGRTWYRYIGYLQATEMQTIIHDFATSERFPFIPPR
ncbi:TlpA family protein disulfide reductase [Ectothiorhodospira shaposhnikovii]|uniref:TlpA family protein disulfide reductase n=1 Tax=Ectothiorhodospira shaposhnikovii TaxID=1054 RepID=UPI00399FAA7A